MSRSIVQPVGQKRLTNVAVVRLKKHGNRFEIACYKNKVIEWRSGVEKDLDEVLQSQIVYSNVSKGVLAKSKDLKAAFGTDDQAQICLEILKKGELQVAGKERESQLSNQFRDIATNVMQMTVNPTTQLPYTISMIERLMHEIHFAVDPRSNSKKQALDVIRELTQKHYAIKRCQMRVKLTLPVQNLDSLEEKLSEWKVDIVSRDESGSQISIVCEIQPGLYQDCAALVRNLQGDSDVLERYVHREGDLHVDHYDGHEAVSSSSSESKEPPVGVQQLSEKMQKQTLVQKPDNSEGQVKQYKCHTCDVIFGDDNQRREHSKSDWHKHNMKRKGRQLPPLSEQECMADIEMSDVKGNLSEYNF